MMEFSFLYVAHGPNIPPASATVDALWEASVRRTMIGIGSSLTTYMYPPPAEPVGPSASSLLVLVH